MSPIRAFSSKPTRVLFLDDMPIRHEALREALELPIRYKQVELTHAYGFVPFKARLEEAEEPYDVVCLDHDLGDGDAYTGYDAAWEVLRLPKEKKPSLVVIHSYNVAAADRMYMLLKGTVDRLEKVPYAKEALVKIILGGKLV